MSKQRCWLVKSEPESFSIDDLAAAPKQTTFWDGVRNYQARNFMREMKVGDRVLYYHSGGTQPAVAGTAVVVRAAYPDHTAWDPSNDHCDAKASPENPIWQMVDIRLAQIFAQPVSLAQMRGVGALKSMELLKRGSRLSVQPVTPREFDAVVALSAKSAAPKKAAKPRATGGKPSAGKRPKTRRR